MTNPLILLVDDDRDMLDAVRRTLARPPARVMATSDPYEAASMLGDNDFDLVISDLQMPGLDGHQLLARAKRACPGAVRIMLTGVDEIAEVKRAINESEVHRFISKPFDPTALKTVVSEAILFRQQLASQLEARQQAAKSLEMIRVIERQAPGITDVVRTESGAYRLDPEHVRRARKVLALGRFSHGL